MVAENGRASYFTAIAHGMQPNGVRQSNQRAVLTVVASSPGLSNAEISRRTRLAPQSVSSVLVELEAEGLLKRGAARHDGGRGQPATPIYLNPEGAYSLGVEIGWTRIEVVLTDFSARVVDRQRRQHDFPRADRVFVDMAEVIEAVVARLSSEARKRIIGLTLAMPARIADPSSLMATPPGERERWAGLDAAAVVQATTGYAVQTMNDGSAACWGEFVAHPSPRPGNFVYLLIDRCLAGGVLTDDRLNEGTTGRGGNFGAMRVTDRQGHRRFAQEIASICALEQRLAAADLPIDALVGELSPEAELVVGPWIEDAGDALARVIANTASVFEFEFAAIESELPGEILARIISATEASLEKMEGPGPRPIVRQGHLGRSGAAQGAAQRRMYRHFYSRELAHLEQA